jgi:hypothetical protein
MKAPPPRNRSAVPPRGEPIDESVLDGVTTERPRLVQVTQAGDASVSEQLDERRGWLDSERIRAIGLHAVRILAGRVTFEATFPNPEDADRFVRAFGDLGWRKR